MDIVFRDFKIASFNTDENHSFFNLIENNRSRLEDFFTGTLSQNKTLKDTITYCKNVEQKVKDKSYFLYIITDSKTDAFIGIVDVKNIDWRIPKAELGYFIDANYEGQGIITKAVEITIDYIIETYNFKKLLCRANSNNYGSTEVAIKNGFQLEGIIRNDYATSKGEVVDLNYYGRIF